MKEIYVQRTNNPWENLHILRELKRKTGCKYTKGLINSDTGSFYVAIGGSIHTTNSAEGLVNIFNRQKYFKNKIKTWYTLNWGLDDTFTVMRYRAVHKRYDGDSTNLKESIKNHIKYVKSVKENFNRRYDKIIDTLNKLKKEGV